ncbi:precorrin-2 dehydrogenase/sirohydrochlorin ferrochelatase family protein [Vibrio quintilis]|uniref:precorrin-2 dehydrogenase n=1 Tax=Vibrio quintilis TaxID=1117707 RepID=A0A1M7YUX1_9VIBR|nr:bifunctional precorrin-2 dehydrogenase/sirohydrochlorin ferrochelatase [Vibrio quintilis]SHO56434.1 Siroheme synthase [Vibrio quintilis]
MQYFPLFLDLKDKAVFVVGGGEVASRKIEALIKVGAQVTLVSPEIVPFLRALADKGEIRWLEQTYHRRLLNGDYVQVWATTNNSQLNHQIHADAKQSGIMVNVVDDQPYCDFITPSMITRGKIQIAISSGGASPVLIRNLRESVESVLPFNLSLLAEFGGRKREQIKSDISGIDARRAFWERFFADKTVAGATTLSQLEHRYQQLLSNPEPRVNEVIWVTYHDDIELLPIKALQFMQKADLVLHQENVEPEILELCRRDANRSVYADSADLADQLKQERTKHRYLCVLLHEQDSRVSGLFEAGDRHLGAGFFRHY